MLLKIEIYVQVLLIPNRTWGQHLNFIDKSKIFNFSESFLADGKRTDAAIETGVGQKWHLLSLINDTQTRQLIHSDQIELQKDGRFISTPELSV